jgi:hypothetical protein
LLVPSPSPPRPALAALVWAVAVALILVLVRQSYWWIGGDDGYYHIRVAAELRERGTFYLQGLPWLRLSVLGETWGDKELLFHWFLVPFARGDLLAGAKVAHSILNGLVAGSIAFVGTRAAGRAGWIAPLVTMAVTSHFLVRMDQLRPHLPSLVLLLFLAHEIGSRRRWSLVLTCFVYALTYTAWQAPLLLCIGCFAAFAVLRKERRWELLYAPAAGLALGILAHPGFPDNVSIWALQNVAFFRQTSEMPVGTEIYGLNLPDFLRANWTGLALLGLIVATRTTRNAPRVGDLELTLGVFAGATLILYLGAIRFAEYAVPFTVLYATAVAVRLPRRPRVEALGVARRGVVAAGVIGGFAVMHVVTAQAVMRLNHGLAFLSEDDIRRFAAAIPDGAAVASTWDFTPFYLHAAPQGRYLNVLDPIFMASRYPAAYDTLEKIHSGVVADVPAALSGILDSDYIAYNAVAFPALARRAETDPRMVTVFQSANHRVDRVDRSDSHGFVTDWDLYFLPDSGLQALERVRADSPSVTLRAYDPGSGRALVAPDSAPVPCWWATRRFAPDEGSTMAWFSSAGSATVYVNGRRIHADSIGNAGVVDARPLALPRVPGQPLVVAVRTCHDRTFGAGFFWRSPAS